MSVKKLANEVGMALAPQAPGLVKAAAPVAVAAGKAALGAATSAVSTVGSVAVAAAPVVLPLIAIGGAFWILKKALED